MNQITNVNETEAEKTLFERIDAVLREQKYFAGVQEVFSMSYGNGQYHIIVVRFNEPLLTYMLRALLEEFTSVCFLPNGEVQIS